MPEIPKRKRRLLKFSLRNALLLISFIAMFTSYVVYHRERGNDRLIADLTESGGSCIFGGKGRGGARPTGTVTETKPTNGWLKDQWLSLTGGSNQDKIIAVDFQSLTREEPETIFKNPALARRIAKNFNTNLIQDLIIERVIVGSQCHPFFSEWAELRHISIIDTATPNSWKSGFAKIPKLESVIISGGKCNLDPECFIGNKSLISLKLAHRGITTERLQRLRKQMPNVEIELLGSFESEFNLPKGQVLSRHDEVASAKLKSAFDELLGSLQSLSPPASNRFNPPATLQEISELESLIGMPLHPTLRAWLELHNGQPSPKHELVTCEMLAPVSQIIRDYRSYKSFAHADWINNYEFIPNFSNGTTGNDNTNPNLLTIGSSEDHLLMFNNVTGKLYHSYSEVSPTYFLPDLESYFLALAEAFRAGRIESQNGYVRLEFSLKEDPFAPWREKETDNK